MRFTRVDRHGKVTQVGGEDNQQIAYGALIHGRTSIIRGTLNNRSQHLITFPKNLASTSKRPLQLPFDMHLCVVKAAEKEKNSS